MLVQTQTQDRSPSFRGEVGGGDGDGRYSCHLKASLNLGMWSDWYSTVHMHNYIINVVGHLLSSTCAIQVGKYVIARIDIDSLHIRVIRCVYCKWFVVNCSLWRNTMQYCSTFTVSICFTHIIHSLHFTDTVKLNFTTRPGAKVNRVWASTSTVTTPLMATLHTEHGAIPNRKVFHRYLAEYFASCPHGPRRTAELPWQLKLCCDMDQLRDVLCDPQWDYYF